MSTRLRYKKEEGGVLASPVFMVGPTAYRAFIFNDNTYGLEQQTGDSWVRLTGGTGTNLHDAKKVVKSFLVSLGVQFTAEKRQRTKAAEVVLPNNPTPVETVDSSLLDEVVAEPEQLEQDEELAS